ncbi:MAG: hypothetical protein JXX14_03350, partial [Deltaproteobacteria bacterium]|nr:hypothetical protein [Deltaproteobacteria bacterium]
YPDGTDNTDSSLPPDTDSASGTDIDTAAADSSQPDDTDTTTPAGYYAGADWRSWHGCMWPATDNLNVGTTITPSDFTDESDPTMFCVDGTLGANVKALAGIGFYVAQPEAAADCSAEALKDAATPPATTPEETGIALKMVKMPTDIKLGLRLDGLDADGTTLKSWCFKGEVGGNAPENEVVYIPYRDFNQNCDSDTTIEAYSGEPIYAVSFFVYGSDSHTTPYQICLQGFADSENPYLETWPWDDEYAGDLGGDGGAPDDSARTQIVHEGEGYIIQNNYFGGDSGYQALSYSNNSFEVIHFSGTAVDAGTPVAYPSIYIGGHALPDMTTAATDNLPIRVSNIASAKTTLTWTGVSGDTGVVYKLWFATSPPADGYPDALDGSVEIWLRALQSHVPVGSDTGETAMLCGHGWNIWAGQRTGSEAIPWNRVVVTYVATTPIDDFSCDLQTVITDAAALNRNGYQIYASWYLTDIIAGFEVWSTIAPGATITDYSAQVQ